VVVWWHGNGTSRTSYRCRDPSVRESWSRPPQPPRLLLCGILTVQNCGHDCLGSHDFCCTAIAQGKQQCINGKSHISCMRGVPSVRESWSRSPRPPQLLRHGVLMVQCHGHDCLGPRDFYCVVTTQGELRHVTVLLGALNITMSHAVVGRHVSTMPHHRIEITTYKTHKGYMGKDAGPTRAFAASLGVGLGVTVGTLKTGYPHVQAPSQDERQDGHTCLRVPRLPSPGTGQLWSRHVPLGSSSHHQGPRQLRDSHVPHGPISHLLAQDSSLTATYPLGSSSRLLA
jgi:hypothetical protein